MISAAVVGADATVSRLLIPFDIVSVVACAWVARLARSPSLEERRGQQLTA
jgi:hypothetical protein